MAEHFDFTKSTAEPEKRTTTLSFDQLLEIETGVSPAEFAEAAGSIATSQTVRIPKVIEWGPAVSRANHNAEPRELEYPIYSS